MLENLKALWRDEEAPTAVEYALMAALVAVAIIAAVQALAGGVNTTFGKVTAAL